METLRQAGGAAQQVGQGAWQVAKPLAGYGTGMLGTALQLPPAVLDAYLQHFKAPGVANRLRNVTADLETTKLLGSREFQGQLYGPNANQYTRGRINNVPQGAKIPWNRLSDSHRNYLLNNGVDEQRWNAAQGQTYLPTETAPQVYSTQDSEIDARIANAKADLARAEVFNRTQGAVAAGPPPNLVPIAWDDKGAVTKWGLAPEPPVRPYDVRQDRVGGDVNAPPPAVPPPTGDAARVPPPPPAVKPPVVKGDVAVPPKPAAGAAPPPPPPAPAGIGETRVPPEGAAAPQQPAAAAATAAAPAPAPAAPVQPAQPIPEGDIPYDQARQIIPFPATPPSTAGAGVSAVPTVPAVPPGPPFAGAQPAGQPAAAPAPAPAPAEPAAAAPAAPADPLVQKRADLELLAPGQVNQQELEQTANPSAAPEEMATGTTAGALMGRQLGQPAPAPAPGGEQVGYPSGAPEEVQLAQLRFPEDPRMVTPPGGTIGGVQQPQPKPPPKVTERPTQMAPRSDTAGPPTEKPPALPGWFTKLAMRAAGGDPAIHKEALGRDLYDLFLDSGFQHRIYKWEIEENLRNAIAKTQAEAAGKGNAAVQRHLGSINALVTVLSDAATQQEGMPGTAMDVPVSELWSGWSKILDRTLQDKQGGFGEGLRQLFSASGRGIPGVSEEWFPMSPEARAGTEADPWSYPATTLMSLGGLSGVGVRSLGDVGTMTDTEKQLFVDYYIPQAADSPAARWKKWKNTMQIMGTIRAGMEAGTLDSPMAVKEFLSKKYPGAPFPGADPVRLELEAERRRTIPQAPAQQSQPEMSEEPVSSIRTLRPRQAVAARRIGGRAVA